MIARLSLSLSLVLTACGSPGRPSPTRRDPFPEAEATLVWHGTGEAHRLEDGVWQRRPEHDYELTVVQRRYGDRWESTKEMHRRHPDYDGSAGPRDQTLHFTVRLAHDDAGDVSLAIDSTLGDGSGRADRHFEQATLRLHADVSSMAPFDTYVIEQRYRYADGVLEETVRLVRSGSAPAADAEWVRIEERARLFAPARFEQPPTVRPPR